MAAATSAQRLNDRCPVVCQSIVCCALWLATNVTVQPIDLCLCSSSSSSSSAGCCLCLPVLLSYSRAPFLHEDVSDGLEVVVGAEGGLPLTCSLQAMTAEEDSLSVAASERQRETEEMREEDRCGLPDCRCGRLRLVVVHTASSSHLPHCAGSHHPHLLPPRAGVASDAGRAAAAVRSVRSLQAGSALDILPLRPSDFVQPSEVLELSLAADAPHSRSLRDDVQLTAGDGLQLLPEQVDEELRVEAVVGGGQ
jgi:hypothetical protein